MGELTQFDWAQAGGDMTVYTLVGKDGVQGARLDMDYEAVLVLLKYLDTDPRIAKHNDIGVPCYIRDQLLAIKKTHETQQQQDGGSTDEQKP